MFWLRKDSHHGAVAFGHCGKALFEVFKYIGVPVEEIGYNQPAGVRYQLKTLGANKNTRMRNFICRRHCEKLKFKAGTVTAQHWQQY